MWAEERVLLELNWNLPAKKNECTWGNNIQRTYSENLRRLRTNQSQKIISNQLNIKIGQFAYEELDLVLRKI